MRLGMRGNPNKYFAKVIESKVYLPYNNHNQ